MDEKTIVQKVVESIKTLFSSGELKIQAEPAKPAELDQLKVSLAEQQKLCQAEKARADKAEAVLAAQAETAALAEFKGKIEAAKAESKLNPAEAANFIALGERLDVAGRAIILEQVASRQDNKLLAELSAKEKIEASQLSKKFAGAPADPLHDRAVQLQAANPKLSFAAAVSQALQENPELGRMPVVK